MVQLESHREWFLLKKSNKNFTSNWNVSLERSKNHIKNRIINILWSLILIISSILSKKKEK